MSKRESETPEKDINSAGNAWRNSRHKWIRYGLVTLSRVSPLAAAKLGALSLSLSRSLFTPIEENVAVRY